MLSIYLAGAMNHYRESNKYQDKAFKWRNDFTNKIYKQYDSELKVFDPTVYPIKDYVYDIVAQNYHFIKKMDIMVVNLEDIDKSLGTIWEMATAYNLGKPIITIGEHRWSEHPHMVGMTSFNASDIEEAAEFIIDAYGL